MCMNRGVLNQISLPGQPAAGWLVSDLWALSQWGRDRRGPRPGSVPDRRGPEHAYLSAVKQAGSFTGPASSQRARNLSLCLRAPSLSSKG